MYKHKAMLVLARMIENGEVSADVDVRKALQTYEWRIKHPKPQRLNKQPRFYARAMSANTRAKKAGQGGKLTHNDLEAVFLRGSGKCAKCATSTHIVFDHVIPLYKGGTNTTDNLQLLCRLCNMLKGTN
jgi:5-methylcytosine-specific restriction endonuclease McrA